MKPFLALMILLLSTPSCFAQRFKRYDDYTYEVLRSILPTIKDQVLHDLALKDVTLLPNIEVIADRRNLTNADAYIDPSTGRRKIVIFNGLAMEFDFMAQILSVSTQYPQCYMSYLRYMYVKYYRNTQRVLAGLSPGQGVTPIFYFKSHVGCSGAANALLHLSPLRQHEYREAYYTSLLFVFLHELAHHQLGHVDHRAKTLVQARAQENAADLWALKRVPRLGHDVIFTLPFFLHAGITGGDSLEDERRSDHPLGVQRLLNMIDALVPEFVGTPQAADVQRLRRMVEAIVRQSQSH